jgi:competence protein ComEA
VVYRRREIWLLLILALSLGVGLAIREFREGFPELANRLENPENYDQPRPAIPIPPRPSKLSSAEAGKNGRLDLNRATAADLQRLPGIGPTLAGQIVRERERRGRFASAEDLLSVPGIGRRKFEAFRDLVIVKE